MAFDRGAGAPDVAGQDRVGEIGMFAGEIAVGAAKRHGGAALALALSVQPLAPPPLNSLRFTLASLLLFGIGVHAAVGARLFCHR